MWIDRTSAAIAALGAIFMLAGCNRPQAAQPKPQKQATNLQASITALEADVAQLNEKASDQAHAMVSVAYHFNNMWFAADAKNWPLAQFYWNETRSHLRWAVRIIPVRTDNAGQEIKLQEILDAFDAIEANDQEKFVAAYRFAIATCYACHKAVEKPFLRPHVPQQPAERTINFDPAADWPK
jgi:hypothetical protein